MDKNQPFFDPYNFNMQHMPNQMPIQSPEMMGIEPMQNVASPTMYYEQQYMYYRYLNQMLEYKMRLKDYERSTRDSKT